MRIDLSALLNGRTSCLEINYSFVPPDEDGFVILPEDVKLTSPVSVRGDVKDNNGYMTLSCHVSVDYRTECARCLDEINGTAEFDFVRYVAVDRRITEDDSVSEDDVLYISDGSIEFDADIVEQLSLELPTYFLCREDCPGLCPKCGARLADGDCGCREIKEIDPRFAILKKLLDNQEEK